MRKITILAALLTVSITWAEQMPDGYYNAANGKSDEQLMEALHQTIRGGDRYNYGSNDYHSTDDPQGRWKKGDLKAYGTWWAFQFTDQRSDGTIWDMYSRNAHILPIKGGSAAGMEIEHCFPKSWWGASSTESVYQKDNAYRDLYHLNPSDKPANTNKSNYPPGIVTTASKFDYSGFRMGNMTIDVDGTEKTILVYEPEDEYKGDFARAYFYIATAYKDTTWKLNTTPFAAGDALDPTTYQLFRPWLTEVLLGWHRQDPVSDKELRRMDAISTIQHNRNPYIEYPELVEYIWGDKKGQSVDLSQLVRTTSEDYDVPVDKVNPIAFEASNVTDNGFTISWKDQQMSYYDVDVFTRIESGHNDTLLNLPGCGKEYLFSHPDTLSFHKKNGDLITSTQGITDGTYAIGVGTASEIRYFDIENIEIGNNVKLVLKCATAKEVRESQKLVVKADGVKVKDIIVTRNDTMPEFDIPEGTKKITIAPASDGQRLSMQQMFLIAGDYRQTDSSISGFPARTSDCTMDITYPMKDVDNLYFNIKPKGLRTSNTVKIRQQATGIRDFMSEPKTDTQKVLRDGQIIIIRDGKQYNMMGIRL